MPKQGAREEPDYPWIWLQLGKLRSHFGDRAGALAATDRGLELVPGDYEFTTLRQEIEREPPSRRWSTTGFTPTPICCSRNGLDENSDSKLQAISCINTDPAGLERFMELFAPGPDTFTVDSPYCSFPYTGAGTDSGAGVPHEPGRPFQAQGGLAAPSEGAAGQRHVADPPGRYSRKTGGCGL